MNTGKTHFQKGNIPWNKGIKSWVKPWLGKKRLDMQGENNPNWKPKISVICVQCENNYQVSLCRKDNTKFCSKQCMAKYNLSGEKHWNFKNWATPLAQRIRTSAKYYEWRNAVYKRDNYTCQECKQGGVFLNADHIKPFSIFPKLRFEISNGRTLCRECHQKTDSWGSKMNVMARKYTINAYSD